MEIRHTWVGIEQPHDDQTAGSPWFYISSYREFQKGLILALQEVEKYSDLIKELELEFSPFEKEKQRLNRMIEWGEDRLKKSGQTSDYGEIRSIGRYIRLIAIPKGRGSVTGTAVNRKAAKCFKG
jgi:hypothetical protein